MTEGEVRMPDRKGKVRVLSPEDFVKAVQDSIDANASAPVPITPIDRDYVNFQFGAGHEMMFNIRLPASELSRVFLYVERFFEKWLDAHMRNAHTDDAEPAAEASRGPQMYA